MHFCIEMQKNRGNKKIIKFCVYAEFFVRLILGCVTCKFIRLSVLHFEEYHRSVIYVRSNGQVYKRYG